MSKPILWKLRFPRHFATAAVHSNVNLSVVDQMKENVGRGKTWEYDTDCGMWVEIGRNPITLEEWIAMVEHNKDDGRKFMEAENASDAIYHW